MTTHALPLLPPLSNRDARRLCAALVVALVASLAVAAVPARGVSWGSKQEMAAIDPSLGALAAGETAPVVVQAVPGRADHVARLVSDAGGTVGVALPVIDGFAATVDREVLAVLEGSRAVVAVTRDREGAFEEYAYDESTAGSSVRTSGAGAAWSTGNYGQGVGVAVIDTGTAEMNDLKGRVVFGPDLSGEGTTLDTYGHGTVMAGVIAGSGADSAGAYTGVAPKAHIISVKAAGRNGVADVSTILQAMHFVSAYKDQLNIRVLNLSWGTPSTQSPSVDPLNYAVQRLWQQGIVVVVAAGNSGPTNGTILKPADDPLVLTVGALDDKQTTDRVDDAVPAWSSRGPTAQGLAKPDVVAPGRTIISSRAFGSKVESENPKALVAPSYIKGSGSSQAAAVASGVAALLLAARPELTPDQVKSMLVRTAQPVALTKVEAQGAGAVSYRLASAADPGPATWQTPTATGLGSIEASRGGRNVQTDCGNDGVVDVIKGEIDVRCEAWNGSSWTGSSWTGSSWTGSSWTGSSWTGSSWTGSSWTGSSWTGSSWTGGSWTGSSWTGSSWTGSSWTGSSWTGSSWTGSSWTTSAYTDFQTAFWGNRPPAGTRIPGELSEGECPPGRGVRTC